MASNSRRKSTMKSSILSHNDFRDKNAHIMCVCMKVIGIGQENLPMYVFSIDISFKGRQSLSNMRSKDTVVSYLHSGVIDTVLTGSVVSLTPLCNRLCRLSSQILSHIRKGFNLCIGDPGEVVWWKKQRSKSRARVPLRIFYTKQGSPDFAALYFFSPTKGTIKQAQRSLIKKTVVTFWMIFKTVAHDFHSSVPACMTFQPS
jgi:hypothetical protein